MIKYEIVHLKYLIIDLHLHESRSMPIFIIYLSFYTFLKNVHMPLIK